MPAYPIQGWVALGLYVALSALFALRAGSILCFLFYFVPVWGQISFFHALSCTGEIWNKPPPVEVEPKHDPEAGKAENMWKGVFD